jgi:hypothetical protein
VNTRAPVDPLTRREALQRAIALLGGAIIGGPALLAACSRAAQAAAPDAPPVSAQRLFDAPELALIDDIADTILPDTATPGARAAQVGPFIALVVADCYTPGQQAAFKAGLADVGQRAKAQHGKSFGELAAADRLALLAALEREQHVAGQAAPSASPRHLGLDEQLPPSARMFKELTLLGYFSSEIGCTQAQRFVAVPGRFDPDVPYHKGDKSWAPMS